MAPPLEFKNFIAGDWVAPSTGDYFEDRNPADWNDVIGRFPRSGPDDLQRAVTSAKRGFAHWSKTPAPIRGQVLQRVGQLLVERKDVIARDEQLPHALQHLAADRRRCLGPVRKPAFGRGNRALQIVRPRTREAADNVVPVRRVAILEVVTG